MDGLCKLESQESLWQPNLLPSVLVLEHCAVEFPLLMMTMLLTMTDALPIRMLGIACCAKQIPQMS